ncbi:MAG: hypothetical protein RSE05_03875 [Clostridium sp.]
MKQPIQKLKFTSEELADYIERYELITAPKHLKDSILEQSHQPSVQLIAGSNQISKKLQFFYFTLKVSGAVLCALMMLSIVPNFSRQQQLYTTKIGYAAEQSYEQPFKTHLNYYEKIDGLTEKLNQWSDKIERY